MEKDIHPVYVSYEEAQQLIPVFEYYVKQGPWKEVRKDASGILLALRDVRDVDYRPLGGQQIFLTEEQYDFLSDVRMKM